MNVSRGDVVLVDYPFSDRTGSKVRPALVIQANALNSRIDDTILAAVSRSTHRASATQPFIDISTLEGTFPGRVSRARSAHHWKDSSLHCTTRSPWRLAGARIGAGGIPGRMVRALDSIRILELCLVAPCAASGALVPRRSQASLAEKASWGLYRGPASTRRSSLSIEEWVFLRMLCQFCMLTC